jgi:molecular chaperone DnaK
MSQDSNNLIPYDPQNQLTRPVTVLGIDLGTTNSAAGFARVAIGQKEYPEVNSLEIVQETLQGEYTNTLLPSILALYQDCIFIGEGAKRLRAEASRYGLKKGRNLFYECKNDIGAAITYAAAPEEFRSATDIATHVLARILKSAFADGINPDRCVVTVPASFQAAQRRSTLAAAKKAGLPIRAGDLLDEPVAAFLSFIAVHGDVLKNSKRWPTVLVVVDSGGGTTDVSVLRIRKSTQSLGMEFESLAVSRYHRLGGGDIDAAIVHECLIPQFCEQNSVPHVELTFEQKKNQLEPALLGLAEGLKVNLCREINRLKAFNAYDSKAKKELHQTTPGTYRIILDGKELALSCPKLCATQFEELLEPFLDTDLLYARETEYRLTCSIFAPIQDALDRAGVGVNDIGFCLPVGGSCNIPQFVDALDKYFTVAEILKFTNPELMTTCVAHGAVHHAICLEVLGSGLLKPIASADICLRTDNGLVTLIRRGVSLPFPGKDEFAVCDSIALPQSIVAEPCDLRMEFVSPSESGDQLLIAEKWRINRPAKQGERIKLEYRIDENQVFQIRASLYTSPPDDYFEAALENPLTNVVNPQPIRLQILAMEEELRLGKIAQPNVSEYIGRLAELYHKMGHHEKAIEFVQRALRLSTNQNGNLLHQLATYHESAGNKDRAIRAYQEAATVDSWWGRKFNLSLAMHRTKRYEEGLEVAKQLIAQEEDGPQLVLAAMLAKATQHQALANELLVTAKSRFGELKGLDRWALGWAKQCADMMEDATMANFVTDLIRAQKNIDNPVSSDLSAGVLPTSSNTVIAKADQ